MFGRGRQSENQMDAVKDNNSAANRKSIVLLSGNNIIFKKINTVTFHRPIKCKTFVFQKH